MTPSADGPDSVGSLLAARGPAEADATAGTAARLLVVVLHYHGLADTLACLASLRAQTGFSASDLSVPHLSVLVVDNGADPGDLARIAAAFPEIETLRQGTNLGWAGGNNLGLRRGLERGCDHVCLLNNDTVLAADALAELLAAAAAVRRETGRPALLHPMIHDLDESGRAQLAPGPAPADAAPAARRLAERDGVVEIGWAYGACLLLPAALVRRVGLLDERFFLQLEEQDYFRRAASLGLRSYCARRARVRHRESASFGGRVTAEKTYYQVRNSLLLAEKHDATPAGIARALRRLLWMLRHQARAARPGAASRLGFISWLLSGDPFARAARQGARDYLCRRFGPRPAKSPPGGAA